MLAYQGRLQEAFECYRRGELDAARRIGLVLLPVGANDAALQGMLGMIAVQQGRFEAAEDHLRPATQLAPDNVPLRINRAFALANAGKLQQAREVAAGTNVPQLERIVAYVDQQQGRHSDAIARFRRVLSGLPEDAESWTNLGLSLTHAGQLGEAVEAFRRALAIRRDPATYLGLSQALVRGEHHEERLAALVEARKLYPGAVPILIALGSAEAAIGHFDEAERAYRDAIARDPKQPIAYLELGMMLESLNRIDAMAALLDEARERGASGPELDFLQGWLFKRTHRFEEALAIGKAAPAAINASRRAQLVGESADRLGRAEQAFAAFSDMNRLSALGPAADHARARDFPGQIVATIAYLNARDEAPTSSEITTPDRRPPIFILGFPRSGTTLLDTLLMNLPSVEVFEEAPMVERLGAEIGYPNGLSSLDDGTAGQLRERYWQLVHTLRPQSDQAEMVVDKFPLHLVRAPLIHRLFPDAPMVFVERHPCDVVLSCFMARFQTNQATVHFHDILSAARLYDLSMQAWTKSVEVLPLRVHTIRYERMVENLESEMRPLLRFLDIPWTDAVLDNRASAARRRHIATASYAQVGEPLYTRAAGRWQHYRQQMAPVLDILAPWAEQLGYAM
ncbi:tetratricopeptide repeat-containing sulfotransferase family protein [Sphingomonas sp.]|uniref:tetratricopeptide repeat-containing sulfotransferase family protein n=1 Tax=Sphingomonas sp. TaxID=28214 RepID=UPI003B3AD95E